MKPHDLPATAHDDLGTVQALARMLDGVGELHFAYSGTDALRLHSAGQAR